MSNCAGLHGRLYAEANSDYNIVLAEVTQSEFNYWMEAAPVWCHCPVQHESGPAGFLLGKHFLRDGADRLVHGLE